nr:retrovirus-related Pol polyprotein from transposon TNT 1-94 [Tanacetum cinerariifolium]
MTIELLWAELEHPKAPRLASVVCTRDGSGSLVVNLEDPVVRKKVSRIGFEAQCQANTPIETHYNLESFVHGASKPIETIRDTTHGFISATLSGSWSLMVSIGVVELIYRYEIYALGEILVPKTIGDNYLYRGQAEVAFPSGVAGYRHVKVLEFFDFPSPRQGVEDLRELLHKQRVKRMASMNTRLNMEKLDGNIIQKHEVSKQVGLKQLGSKQVGFKQLGVKQVGFKQLGPSVETGVHEVHDEKHVWFEVELQGVQGNREAEFFGQYKSVQMPLGGHFKLSLKDCPIRDCDVERTSKVPYENAVGSLMYLMVCTRTDIAYARRSIWPFTEAVKEAIWLKGLSKELVVELNRVTVNCDNQGAIHLSRNQVFHERTKHINVRYHFIREVLEAKTVKVLKVGTEHNAADALTKVVPGHKLQHCLELLSVGIG